MLFISVDTNGIHWAAETYCVSLIMLFISSTWDVCYVHTHHIVPLGAANRFVWPGSLFCLSPALSLSPLPPPYPPPLVPKPDIKKGLLKNNMGNFLPPWETSPCWEDSQTSLSLLPSLFISLYRSIAGQQRFGGVTTTVGGWWGEDGFGLGRQRSVSFRLPILRSP